LPRWFYLAAARRRPRGLQAHIDHHCILTVSISRGLPRGDFLTGSCKSGATKNGNLNSQCPIALNMTTVEKDTYQVRIVSKKKDFGFF
jgi:hypothetical protein